MKKEVEELRIENAEHLETIKTITGDLEKVRMERSWYFYC